MSQFIHLLKDRTSSGSVILYCSVIAIAIAAAFLSQYSLLNKSDLKNTVSNDVMKGKKIIESYIQWIWLALSFFVLWFISAFADCGADRETYGSIFSNVSISDLLSGWQEPGFILFNMFFRIFGDDPRVIYIAISTVTLFLLYRTWYKLRNEVLIGYGVLAFTTMFYVQSLSLMRIYMASAMLFAGVKFLRQGEYGKYSLVILLTSMIHYSSLLMFLPLGLMYILENRRYRKYVLNILIIVVLVMVFFAIAAGGSILSSIPIFSRFQSYLQNVSFSNIGVMQFVYNIPICILAFFAYYLMENKTEKNMLVAFTSAAFFYALLSYGIQVFGRVNSLFSVLYFFLIPMCMRKMKDYFMSRGKKGKIIYSMLSCACVIYYVFRFVIYLGEYCDLDMIIPYTNVLF